MYHFSIGVVAALTLLFILIFAFEVWMFIDALRNPSLKDSERILWCTGMLFIHPIVAIAYYLTTYSGRG